MLKYLFFIGFIFSSSASASASDECDYTLPLGSIVACYENKNEESDAVLNKSYNDLKNWSWVAHMTMKQRECIGQILLNHKKIGYK